MEITELKAKLHDKANVEENLADANNKITEYGRQVFLLIYTVTSCDTACDVTPYEQ